MEQKPAPKRPRSGSADGKDSPGPDSLIRPISPPRKKQQRESQLRIRSPWQLTWIRDLSEEDNKDAITLKDILGDPLISECWEFNYLHDIGFLMDAFDPDVRHLVKVHVVHGFWKREDQNRLVLEQEASALPNVTIHIAPMDEMFGTHHSKMMILFRHDATAQVIIHTANMIPKDWTNMTNAVWKSPLLPKLDQSEEQFPGLQDAPFGSGQRFKSDLLKYLSSYDSRRITCRSLVQALQGFDFSAVRGVLVASIPGRHNVNDLSQTPWGWFAMRRHLKSVPCEPDTSEVVVQISSIATLGAKDDWLQKTLYESLAKSSQPSKRPEFKVVFPSAQEIRESLDGYASGGSIHMRIQSPQQSKQLDYLRRLMYHWSDTESALTNQDEAGDDTAKIVGAGCRDRAAPHIKTYIRYNSKGTVDWALLTSANLSKQAWGEAVSSSNTARIASWEIGVLQWPELLHKDSLMVPVFDSDVPDPEGNIHGADTLIGIRVPYSMPLKHYTSTEQPWVASLSHHEEDWLGQQWILGPD